ncbi:MAG: hypothetical protein LBM98_11850 [Oscillospiraceae bacterium]|nr:hypothetical protein [Oscillospiraceae bacterium]
MTAHCAGTLDVGRWTWDAGQDEGTGLGLLRAARNDGAPGRWTGEGGFETRPYVTPRPLRPLRHLRPLRPDFTRTLDILVVMVYNNLIAVCNQRIRYLVSNI